MGYEKIQKVRWKLHEVATDMYVKRSVSTLRHWLLELTWIKTYTSGGYVRLDKKALSQIRSVAWITENFRMSVTGIDKMHKMKTLDAFLDLHQYEKPNYFV